MKNFLPQLLVVGFALSLLWVNNAICGRVDPAPTEDISSVFTPAVPQKFSLFSFKDVTFDFFPVPVVQTSPDTKQSYGIMPVILLSDKHTKAIQTIIAGMLQYNTITKWNGTALYYYFPHPNSNPDEIFQLFYQIAQKYYRETDARYYNPHFLNHFYLDASFIWLKTPYRRFYGYGPDTLKTAESNYVSRNFYTVVTFGYYILPTLRANLTENLTSTDVLYRAIDDAADTLTAFAGQSGVNDSTNLIHRLSLTYDTRPQGANSQEGFFAEGAYFFSLKSLASDNTMNGFSAEAIHLHTLFHGHTTTMLRAFVQDMYGHDIPFYLQSTLGGDRELRSYIPNRFTDNGKYILTWEQRINVLKKSVFGVPAELSIDPFVEVGSVFDNFRNIGKSVTQPVGGIGIRFIVPPNVVARIDTAYGKEGYSIYTQLGYPF